MVLLDTVIPRRGNNAQIAYLENFVAKKSPVPETGFRTDDFFLTKRLGTVTSDNRETDGDIVGHIVSGNNIYIRDDECKIYRYNYTSGVYTFEKIYDNLLGCTLDISVKSKALEVPYISGLSSNGVVNTYSATSPYTLTTTGSTFSSGDLNKYVYIAHVNNTGNFSTGGGQYARISKVNSATSVDLSAGFVINPIAGDKVEVYDDINNVIIFNDIRKTVTDSSSATQDFGLVLYDNGSALADGYLRSMIGDDILFFESRLRTVEGGSTLGASYISNYEIIDSTTVIGTNSTGGRIKVSEDIIAIDDYQKFLIIYSTNSMSVIRAIATTDGTTLYGYSNGLNGLTLFGPYAMTKKEGVPFIVTNTKQVGLIEIDAVNEGVYNINFNNQGFFLQDILNDRIEFDDKIVMFSDTDTVNISVIKNSEDKTYIFRYYQNYQWRMPQFYGQSISTAFSYFIGDSYYAIGNRFCIAQGEKDLGEEIKQTLKVVGPQKEEAKGRMGYMQQIVFMVGYYDNKLNFDVELALGGHKFKLVVGGQTDGTLYTTRQNLASADGTLGTNILGFSILGGENIVRAGIDRMAMLGFKVGKGFAGYYELILTNKDNSNVNIGMIEPQYLVGNPYLVPIKNTF